MAAAPASSDPPTPTPSGRLLSLVRKLIDYGTQLAVSFRARNAATAPAGTATGFGTSSIAVILARIALALHRAHLLEARIVRIAPRLDAPRPARPSPLRAPRPTALRASQLEPSPDALPTVEQIAAKMRRQPIGAVVADICRDLGILPSHPLWRELQLAIITHGGSAVRLFNDQLERVFPIAHIAARFKRKPAAPACAAGTGPPPATGAQPPTSLAISFS